MHAFCYDYAIIGGDSRQVCLAAELAKEKGNVCHFALCQKLILPAETDCLTPLSSMEAAISNAASIICPIPLSKDKKTINQSGVKKSIPLKQILQLLKPGQRFFAGCIPEDFHHDASEKGVLVFDLMQDDELSYFNTIATAEGVICEAISHSPINLRESRCAVLGFGKCGRTLTDDLRRMLCHVTVATEPAKERAMAIPAADEVLRLDAFFAQIAAYDFIFNTIPATILKKEALSHAKPSVTILDIASAPGGVDFSAAKELSLTALSCPSLPGRYAPLSSALAMLKSIKKFERR